MVHYFFEGKNFVVEVLCSFSFVKCTRFFVLGPLCGAEGVGDDAAAIPCALGGGGDLFPPLTVGLCEAGGDDCGVPR